MIMKPTYHRTVQAGLAGLFLVAVTARGHAQSAAGPKPAAAVHGEPINAPPPATPAPKAATASVPAAGVKPASTASAAPAAATPAAAATNLAASAAGQSDELDWEDLASYEFENPEGVQKSEATLVGEANSEIPAAIKKLDGKKTSITGFVLPLVYQKGQITQFLVLRNQSACCFGVAPKITEWVNVKLKGEGLETPPMDQPVTVRGMLHVGAVMQDRGIVDLYQMDGAQLVDY
jgi:hypothetical protein